MVSGRRIVVISIITLAIFILEVKLFNWREDST